MILHSCNVVELNGCLHCIQGCCSAVVWSTVRVRHLDYSGSDFLVVERLGGDRKEEKGRELR